MTVTVRAVLKKLYPSIIYMYIASNIYLHVLSADQVLSEPGGGGGRSKILFFDVPSHNLLKVFIVRA